MTLPAGARLGPYEIVDLIGRGGMGEVYRAKDERLGRDVAIKILPPGLSAHSEALKRFRREARAVAALSHPNIVALFDIGDSTEGPYVVTELLDGETLRGRLQRGALPMDDALRVALAIADGLGAAHDKGIIHRDLKPENVVLTAAGGVKILDFGLAATHRPPSGVAGNPDHQTEMLTEPGLVIGTIGYMAPEQLRGKPLTPACDIFALGCVTFEMLRGEMPFQHGSNFDVIASVLRDEPFARDATDMPSEVRALLEHCLAKNPEARIGNGNAAASALREVLRKHDDGHLSTMKTVRVPRRWLPGVRPFLAMAGVVVLLAVAAALWSSYSPRRQVIDGGYDLRAGDVSGSEDVRRLVALALRADAAGDRPQAVELCREAARLDSHTPLPAAFLASFSTHGGDPRQGEVWSAETKRRLQGNSSTTYETLLSRYLMPENESAMAMALAGSMLELRPDAWRLRLALAHAHLDRRELPAMLTQLMQIDPSRPDDRRLAIVLADRAALGDVKGATRDLERSHLKESPALLGYARGRIAWSRGDAAEAVRQYDTAVEYATSANLPSIAIDSRVLAGMSRIGMGDLAGAQATFDLAAVKARAAGMPQLELEALAFGAYVAFRRGDAGGTERRLTAASALADPETTDQAELELLSARTKTNVAFRSGTASRDGDMHSGVESLIAARQAWQRGETAAAAQLLRQARGEGIDSTWFAEEAALLDYDLGAPPRTFKPDPPYPNRLRFIPIWEMTRDRDVRR
jgi:tetratricopeptide (TPR) repeat protein